MQKPSSLLGQCSKGHDVYVSRDLVGEIDGATIGADVVAPLRDGQTRGPLVVACEACVDLVNKHVHPSP